MEQAMIDEGILGRRRHLSLSEARRSQIDTKIYTNWINHHLQKVEDGVEDLFTDFRSGAKLLKLIESLTGHKFTQERGIMRVHYVNNVTKALDYLQKEKRMKLHGIDVGSIVDGKEKDTLALVWNIIRKFMQKQRNRGGTLDVSMEVVKKELKQWAQRETEGYKELNVTNLTSSWSDGMAFCAIIHRHRPDLLDYRECHPSQPQDNLKKAFAAAETLGVARLIDPDEDDITEHLVERTVVMELQMLRDIFEAVPPTHDSKALEGDATSREPSVSAPEGIQLAPDAPQANYETGMETNQSKEEKDFANHFDHQASDSDGFHETSADTKGPAMKGSTSASEPVTDAQEISHEVVYEDSASRQAQTDTSEHFKVIPDMPHENSQTEFADGGNNSTDPIGSAAVPKRSRSQKGKPFGQPNENEFEKIHQKVEELIRHRPGTPKFKITPTDTDNHKLQFEDSDRIFWVRMVGNVVMVRVGGGWEPLEEYLDRHYPSQRGKPLPCIVSEEDQKSRLSRAKYPQNLPGGSDQANAELSDAPTMPL